MVTDREGVIDYLLEGVYDEGCARSQEEFLPHLKIPLLEQHLLAEEGYAKAEELVSVS